MLKVIGHRNPDTDTICSAIVYAWFLKERRQQDATPFALGDPNKETEYVLERFGQTVPEMLTLNSGDQLVIVDTNNPAELPSELGVATVCEVVDHHKLAGGLATSEPLIMTVRPYGCTATVIWTLFSEDDRAALPKPIAGLMLAAILSDTLKMTSPTTTDLDRQVMDQLARIAEVDSDELAAEMFAAKSNLEGMSMEDILLTDSKVFTLGGKKIRISSLETTSPAEALSLQRELSEAMLKIKETEGLDGMFLYVVDILKSEAVLLVPGDFERETAEKGYEKSFTDGVLVLPGVVSRKKQMVPVLEKVLEAGS